MNNEEYLVQLVTSNHFFLAPVSSASVAMMTSSILLQVTKRPIKCSVVVFGAILPSSGFEETLHDHIYFCVH